MDYNTMKLTIFNLISNSSRSIIEGYLHKLSIQCNTPYNDVVDDFNEYNSYLWKIEHK